MPRYKIPVTRVGYACRTIDVQADDLPAAQRLALDSAGDHRFSEHEAEYRLADEPPADSYAHLRPEQQDRIRRLAVDCLVGDILGDKDNPRFWAGQIVTGWGLDQCMEQIGDKPEELIEVLGFDPHTGKETQS